MPEERLDLQDNGHYWTQPQKLVSAPLVAARGEGGFDWELRLTESKCIRIRAVHATRRLWDHGHWGSTLDEVVTGGCSLLAPGAQIATKD